MATWSSVVSNTSKQFQWENPKMPSDTHGKGAHDGFATTAIHAGTHIERWGMGQVGDPSPSK